MIPAIGFDWKISGALRLESRGLTLRLTDEARDDLRLWVEGGGGFRDYRLDDRGLLPGGAVEDGRLTAGIGVEWRPLPFVLLAAQGGAALWQRTRLFEEDGDSRGSVRSDPAPFVAIQAALRLGGKPPTTGVPEPGSSRRGR